MKSFFQFIFSVLERIAPKIGARLALYFFLKPYPLNIRREDQELFQNSKSKHFTLYGKQIHYYVFGNAPYVLCSHGFSGSVGQFSEMIRAFRRENVGVIALDLPGHGKSSSGSSNALEFSEAIEKILSIESISMVVAHSLSGVAMAIIMEKSGLRPLKQVLLATSVESKDIMTDFIKEIHAGYRIREQLVNLLQRRFNRSFNDFSVFEIFNELHNLPPTLYVLDEDDTKIPIEHLDKMSHIKHVQTMRTQGLGHNKILWNQDVIKEVLKFYREQ